MFIQTLHKSPQKNKDKKNKKKLFSQNQLKPVTHWVQKFSFGYIWTAGCLGWGFL